MTLTVTMRLIPLCGLSQSPDLCKDRVWVSANISLHRPFTGAWHWARSPGATARPSWTGPEPTSCLPHSGHRRLVGVGLICSFLNKFTSTAANYSEKDLLTCSFDKYLQSTENTQGPARDPGVRGAHEQANPQMSSRQASRTNRVKTASVTRGFRKLEGKQSQNHLFPRGGRVAGGEGCPHPGGLRPTGPSVVLT